MTGIWKVTEKNCVRECQKKVASSGKSQKKVTWVGKCQKKVIRAGEREARNTIIRVWQAPKKVIFRGK